ncbi:MAG: hypothetical protein IJF71_01240 [Clostridia bacterium]|nr:hypothetical protein [Clostridia bacterium]
MKECVLYDRACIDCGECDRCDLDPNKICDNCMKCVGDKDPEVQVTLSRQITEGLRKRKNSTSQEDE